MKRNSFAMEVKNGKMADFRSRLGQVWIELTAWLDDCNIRNFSMWNVENIIFGYYETDDAFEFNAAQKQKAIEWMNTSGDSFRWISTPFAGMRLMYHDFGIVRNSKELIRHRVFVTKLKPGTEEEYKARHDALIKARCGNMTEGPDSNFSIWNAGGYIFGYNEIDTTMERDRTEYDKQIDIAWETQMLEIMTWITNDVDWITGECHENIKKICWHN